MLGTKVEDGLSELALTCIKIIICLRKKQKKIITSRQHILPLIDYFLILPTLKEEEFFFCF